MNASQWKQCGTYQSIRGKDCEITLEARPVYCDRGNFLAKLFAAPGAEPINLDIDAMDGWPRYYFDEIRAKLEIEAWLKKRKQWEGPPF